MFLFSLFFLLLLPLWAFIVNSIGIRLGVFKNVSPQIGALFSIGFACLFVLVGFFICERAVFLRTPSLLFILTALPLLGHLYFQVFNLSETARRIRILVSIKLGIDMPTGRYSTDSLMKVRIERLLQLKQITQQENRYHALPKTLTFAAVFLKAYERVLFPRRK